MSGTGKERFQAVLMSVEWRPISRVGFPFDALQEQRLHQMRGITAIRPQQILPPFECEKRIREALPERPKNAASLQAIFGNHELFEALRNFGWMGTDRRNDWLEDDVRRGWRSAKQEEREMLRARGFCVVIALFFAPVPCPHADEAFRHMAMETLCQFRLGLTAEDQQKMREGGLPAPVAEVEAEHIFWLKP